MMGNPPLMRAEDKTNQVFDVYRDNIVKVSYNMSDTCWWDDMQYNNTNYGFHINAAPSAGTNKPLRIYYANSSYTGNPQISPYTELIGQIQPTDSYGITPLNSNYYHITFSSDHDGSVGTVEMTENFSFIFETAQANIGAKWNIYYADDIHDHTTHIHNFNDTNSTFISGDDGDTYTKTNGTIDTFIAYAKLDSTDEIMFKAYAQMNGTTHGAGSWSSVDTELIDEANLPPNNPDIVLPDGTYTSDNYTIGDIINITYGWLGDPNHETCWVNTTVHNSTHDIVYWLQNRTITHAETLINNTWWYDWDTIGADTGIYYINITVTDPDSVSAYGRQNGTFTLKKWNFIESWNFSFSNVSIPGLIESWAFSFSNTSWTVIDSWNFSFSNSSVPTLFNSWDFSFSNTTSDYTLIDSWEFSFSNTSWSIMDSWNWSWSNTSIPILTGSFNFSFSNISIEWNNIETWTISFSNSTIPITITITNEYPTNSSSIPYIIPSIYFTINISDGSSMSYTIYWGESQDNLTTNISFGGTVNNGTYYHSFTNASNRPETYYWSVNVTNNAGIWTNETYSFNTRYESSGQIRNNNSTAIALAACALLIGVLWFIKKRRKK